MNMATANLSTLTKADAQDLLSTLGVRKNFAQIAKADLIKMLGTYSLGQLVWAAHQLDAEPEFIDLDEGETMPAPIPVEVATPKRGTSKLARHADEAEGEGERKSEVFVSATAGKPDVTRLAELLAELVASGNGPVNAEAVRGIVDQALATEREQQQALIDEAIKTAVENLPARKLEIVTDGKVYKMEGVQHKRFPQLLAYCATRELHTKRRLNVWLAGPAASGKTTACEKVAEALKLPFYTNGALGTKYELFGFRDANGNLQRTPFREAWEHGGVYLYDECDGSASNVLLAFNAALANGICAFPDGMVKRHQDCVILAAANTWGHGATEDYVGRVKLDKAFLNRFVKLPFDYDEALEVEIAGGNKAWVKKVQRYRANAISKGLKVLITPRASMYGAALLAHGVEEDEVIEATIKAEMTAEQFAMIS
jgi:hypothetical protein